MNLAITPFRSEVRGSYIYTKGSLLYSPYVMGFTTSTRTHSWLKTWWKSVLEKKKHNTFCWNMVLLPVSLLTQCYNTNSYSSYFPRAAQLMTSDSRWWVFCSPASYCHSLKFSFLFFSPIPWILQTDEKQQLGGYAAAKHSLPGQRGATEENVGGSLPSPG